MSASRPGNPDRGWNDPPMFNYSSRPVQQPSTPKRLLNKRVAFPATNLPPPGHAVLSPSEGPPPGKTKVHDGTAGIPIPKVIQAAQVGNSALPPALQVVTTSVVDQDAPLSPVLLPPSADTSMPVTVPVLVPAIVDLVRPQPGQSQEPAVEDERLADLLSRLQLDDDSQLLGHVIRDFGTVKDRCCKMLTEKACDDIHRKLEMFEDKWKKGSLTEAVKVKITHLAAALLHEEIDRANHLHLALMVDHIAEVNQWMMGVKKLIQQQQLFLKEIELSSRNSVSSGQDNDTTDNTTDDTTDNTTDDTTDNTTDDTTDNITDNTTDDTTDNTTDNTTDDTTDNTTDNTTDDTTDNTTDNTTDDTTDNTTDNTTDDTTDNTTDNTTDDTTDNTTETSVDVCDTHKSGEQSDNKESTLEILEIAVECCDNKEIDTGNMPEDDADKQTSDKNNTGQEEVLVENDSKVNARESEAVNQTDKQIVNGGERTDLIDEEDACLDNEDEQIPAKADAVDSNSNDQGFSENIDMDNTKCDTHNSADGNH